MDAKTIEKQTLKEKINTFVGNYEHALQMLGSVVGVAMIIAYAGIGLKVLINLAEYDEGRFILAVCIFGLMIICGCIGLVLSSKEPFCKLPVPITINIFMICGSLVIIVALVVLCCVVFYASVLLADVADVITMLIIS